MRRRTYLGALASAVALAGCTGDGGDGEATPTPTAEPTPTETPTPTPEPTETPTPTPTEPQIERANLVWGAGSGDWLTENAIDSAGIGAAVQLGFDYVFPAERSNPEGRLKARVMDTSGSTVQTEEFGFDFDAADTDLIDEIGWAAVDMDGQPAGSYTAELTLTNRYTREASDPARIEFDLVEPLHPSDVALRDYRPQTVGVGESFRFELDLENRSSRDSSIVDQVGYREPDWNTSVNLNQVSYEIPANSRVTKVLGSQSFDEPVTLIFVLLTVDIEWRVEVTEE